MKKVVVLTGAGISAESGIKTFRDGNGLWENYDVMEVASLQGWHKNPALVLDFYNQRRRQLQEVLPNAAHIALAELQTKHDVTIITQNVDDLHERAGSTNVLHLHGELLKARSTGDETIIYQWEKDILPGDKCEKGFQLRPHIVWFGEMVPAMTEAAIITNEADVVIITGTSLQVYPAAGLIGFAREGIDVYYVDPNPGVSYELNNLKNLKVIAAKATVGIPQILQSI